MLAELRESNTLFGRAVERWRPPVVSENGLEMELSVTFAPVVSHSPYFAAAAITDYYVFPALGVAALEREQERQQKRGKTTHAE
jgi:hypothetical protein